MGSKFLPDIYLLHFVISIASSDLADTAQASPHHMALVILLNHSHSMKNGLETWQSQRTSVLSCIITIVRGMLELAKNDCARLL